MSKSKQIVIIGGTGNGLVIAQIILDLQQQGENIQLVGFLNDHLPSNSYLYDWPVLGKPASWQDLNEDYLFCFALLSVGKMEQRIAKMKSLHIPMQRLAKLIHPTAMIGLNADIGAGSVICSHVSVQPNTRVGQNTIVRAGANLGHDTKVADYVDIGPNACLCGYASIQQGTHIAANTVVQDNRTVGELCTIGAGAALFRDAPSHSTWLGNPARRVG